VCLPDRAAPTYTDTTFMTDIATTLQQLGVDHTPLRPQSLHTSPDHNRPLLLLTSQDDKVGWEEDFRRQSKIHCLLPQNETQPGPKLLLDDLLIVLRFPSEQPSRSLVTSPARSPKPALQVTYTSRTTPPPVLLCGLHPLGHSPGHHQTCRVSPPPRTPPPAPLAAAYRARVPPQRLLGTLIPRVPDTREPRN